jgi:nitroreductase
MDFFETIKIRRSIRRFTTEAVPEEVMRKALHAATLAPNSSNTQTWNFFWVRSPEKKARLVEYCLSQSAARTAAELVVFVASPKMWRRSQPGLVHWVKDVKAAKDIIFYYEKLIPYSYRWGILNSWGLVKKIVYFGVGLFRPITRGPAFKGEIQEVAIKSTALAAENFVLAIAAQGFASCMMEGFDEWRVKRLLNLGCSDRVVMVVGIGREQVPGTWGYQYRIPAEQVIHEV